MHTGYGRSPLNESLDWRESSIVIPRPLKFQQSVGSGIVYDEQLFCASSMPRPIGNIATAWALRFDISRHGWKYDRRCVGILWEISFAP